MEATVQWACRPEMDDKQNGLSLADTAERLRLEQLDMLARLFQVMAFAGLNTIVFLYWVFYSNTFTIGWVAPLGALVVVYGFVLHIGYSWRRRRDPHTRAETSSGYMHYYVGTVLLLGSLWAALLFGLNSIAAGDQRSILYATTIGVISAAAVLQPMRVALAFWGPVTLGASFMLAQSGRFIDLQIFGLLLGYSPLILFTALFINRTLVRRVRHEAKLQDQADVIGLLLRDFEANSSHWLWETDNELRLKNVSPRFADIAQTPAELLTNRSIFEVLRVQTLARKDDRFGDLEAVATIQAEMTGGCFASVSVSALAPYRTQIEVAGSEGVLVAENGLAVDDTVRVELWVGGQLVEAKSFDNSTSYSGMLDSFARAMRGEAFAASAQDGVRNMRLLDAIYRGWTSGGTER